MSTYIEATGAGFAPQDQVEMRWNADGGLTLYAPTHNHGQGHETVFAQLVARELGIPMEKIALRTAGADFYITGNATGGSRSLAAVGSVLMLAAREMVKKGMNLAAEKLEAAPSDIEFAQGRYRIKGTDRSVAIADLAKDGKLDLAYQNKFGSCFPERLPHRRGRDRAADRDRRDRFLRGVRRRRQHRQPPDRRGPGAGWPDAGRGPGFQ